MIDGKYYRLKIKALFGNGTYETMLKYDGFRNAFFTKDGACLKPDNPRIVWIKEEE